MCIVRRAIYPGAVGLALTILAALIVPGFAQEKGKNVKPQPIPLKSVYVTSEQKGLKRVAIGHGNFDRQVLEELYRSSIKVGLSNVFLVRGADITDAVRATKVAFDSGIGAGEPISADQLKKDEHIWMVAYFGVAGSDPPAFAVKSVDWVGDRARVSFAHDGAETGDLVPYFAWVPLGRLGVGSCALELYDVNGKEVMMARTVRIRK